MILILVLVLLLLLQLGKTQVLARMFIIGIATQGMLVELYSLVILLTAVGDVTQVIASFTTQLFVLCTLGKIGEDALGLLHRVLVIIFLRSDTALTHECSGEVELGLLARGIGLQCFAVLDFCLGKALFLIELVTVAQAHSFLLGHLGCLTLSHGGKCHARREDSQHQRSDYIIYYLVESHFLQYSLSCPS